MSRRPGRRDGRVSQPQFYFDPFLRFGFDYAWRASDAVGSPLVTSIPPYIGALTLLPQGTGQAAKALSANLGGRYSIAVDGVTASGGYTATLPGTPTELTVFSVGYLANVVVSAVYGTTVGGTVNTGTSQYRNTLFRSGKLTTEATATCTTPLPFVVASVFTSAGVTQHFNRYTSSSASLSGALAGTSLHAMCRASNASIPQVMTGEWATLGIALRALLPSEVALTLRMLGRFYGVQIAA